MEPNTTDSVGPSLTKPSRSLDDLGPEILILIFEELYSTEGSDGCKPVRLVSRALCAAVVPLFYRDINFKPGNPCKPLSLSFRSHLNVSFENAYTYARSARIDVKMNWVAVAAFLMKCRQLERLDWAYWENVASKSPIPTPIQDFLRKKSPRVCFYVWGCSMPWPRTTATNVESLEQVPHIASIPTSNLVSLSMYSWMCRGRNIHKAVMELVTTSPHLESLELLLINSNFHGNKRLPPIKHLSLGRCDWTCAADDVSRAWDFSRLETLRLVDRTNTLKFMQSVPSKQLPCLKSLTMECVRHTEHERFTELLGQFLLETPQLLEIGLTCQLWSLSIPSIARHSSLRILSLKDCRWAGGRGEVVGTIAVPDLALLQTECKNLAELTLDVRDYDASIAIFFE